MSQFRLVCNFKQCRKTLLQSAYVTKCSHMFCNEHGLNISSGQELKCPVCNNLFQTIHDVIRVKLNPDEVTKSVMAAGLRPEVIMDIATRALTFWGYQLNEENLYLEAGLKTANDNIAILEKYCENTHAKYKSEINTLERKIDSLNEELEINIKRCKDLIQQLEEKSKLIYKLQLNSVISPNERHQANSQIHNVPMFAPSQRPVEFRNTCNVSKQEQSTSLKKVLNGTQNNGSKFKTKPINPPQSVSPMHPFHRRYMYGEQDFRFQPNME